MQYPNPLFMEPTTNATPARPGSMYQPISRLDAELNVTPSGPAVALPDAGNLFEAMHVVISESAPHHLQERVLDCDVPSWDSERPFLVGMTLSDTESNSKKIEHNYVCTSMPR